MTSSMSWGEIILYLAMFCKIWINKLMLTSPFIVHCMKRSFEFFIHHICNTYVVYKELQQYICSKIICVCNVSKSNPWNFILSLKIV